MVLYVLSRRIQIYKGTYMRLYLCLHLCIYIDIHIFMYIYIHMYRLHMSKISFHRPQPLPKSKTYHFSLELFGKTSTERCNCHVKPHNFWEIMWNVSTQNKGCCHWSGRPLRWRRVMCRSAFGMGGFYEWSFDWWNTSKRNDSKSLNWKKIHLPNLESQWSQG